MPGRNWVFYLPALINLPCLLAPEVILLGYTVLAARTPVDAINLVGKHPGDIHLLITDVVIPEMHGRQLTEKLSAIRPDLKCLYMSGYTAWYRWLKYRVSRPFGPEIPEDSNVQNIRIILFMRDPCGQIPSSSIYYDRIALKNSSTFLRRQVSLSFLQEMD